MSDQDEQPEHEQHFRVEGMVPTGDAIITARFDRDDSHTYDGYVSSGGYTALRKALTEMSAATVHNEIKLSEIQGRGGAGFPAGIKWGFLPEGVYPRYVVVNGDESEPGTYKDRMLMERDPHQLIEGTVLTCYAVDAAQAFLYVRGEMALAQERLAQALNEAYERNLVGRNVLGSDFSVDITLTWGAGAYIVGEETALIESLEGERGMPRLKPPFFPAVKGLYLQPTIVNNVETLANVPYIVNEGGQTFHDIGAPTSTGMRMFAVSGHVNRPGVFEVPNGVTTFRMLFEAPEYCGGVRDGRAIKAFIPGGASAPWFYEEHLDFPLDKPTVDKAGSMLGSGAIVVMDERTDVVAACWRIVRFFARESCGKCTPCREGTTWLERVLKRILDGAGRAEDLDTLLSVSENISPGLTFPPRQTTICPLGPSAVAPITSAIERFRDEFEHYIDHGVPKDGIDRHPITATGVPVHA
ncbi:MAG: NADH-quinone oxidoreductase subunit NuoF [Actinomycetota bacterium]|jgi:NADH-quinone oxidoreductase subunit F|nr:NADH-quinone oxidoreductase subunit NuoF [Actinomycetota bacterium]